MVAQRLTGAEIIVEYLVKQGVRYAAGIPGHGAWTLTDALLDKSDEIRTVQVMHEQSAVHLADGFYRASGAPMLAFTSIGPGATNTVIGMATAYVDSTAVALFTGSPHTYMRGAGLLQELDRRHVADNPRIFEPVVKEWWQPSRVDELPFVLHRAWNQMLSGRPGPILLDLPMDVLAEAAEVTLPEPDQREARGRARPAGDDVEWQGRHRRDLRPGSADDRRHRVVVRQRARRLGRRHPLGRLPVHRLVGLVVPRRRDLLDPADPAHPARHRPARDRQELSGRGSPRRRRKGRSCRHPRGV